MQHLRRNPPHIPGLAGFPDLKRDYDREWRRLLAECPAGCDAQILARRYIKAVERRQVLVAPSSRSR